jgi:hypothetical protein
MSSFNLNLFILLIILYLEYYYDENEDYYNDNNEYRDIGDDDDDDDSNYFNNYLKFCIFIYKSSVDSCFKRKQNIPDIYNNVNKRNLIPIHLKSFSLSDLYPIMFKYSHWLYGNLFTKYLHIYDSNGIHIGHIEFNLSSLSKDDIEYHNSINFLYGQIIEGCQG